MKSGSFNILRLFLVLLAVLFSLTACESESDAPTKIAEEAKENAAELESSVPIETENKIKEELQNFPSLYLDIAADDIDHNEWAWGIKLLLQGAGEEFDIGKNVRVRVRGRGNATWNAMGDKRPLRIRFEAPRSMFGTEYIARDWVLLANTMDYSLMRTVGALSLGARLGRFEFSPIPAQFVHLYLDGEYWGVYQFTDQMRQGEGRVDVTPNPDPELSEYYIEWDRHGRSSDVIFIYVQDIPFRIRYPNPEDITPEHIDFLSDFLHEINQAIRDGDYDEVATLIDIPTFIDFYLVNEFTKNADVFFSSVHLSVRIDEDNRHRLYAGPLWDFDQSAGGTSDDFYPDYSPQGTWAAESNEWLRRLMRIPEFRTQVSQRWYEIRDVEVADTLEEIRHLSTTYRDDFYRNFERWTNLLGQYLWRTPREMRAIDTYEGQVDYLLDWYEQRIVWMDEFLR